MKKIESLLPKFIDYYFYEINFRKILGLKPELLPPIADATHEIRNTIIHNIARGEI